MSKKNKVFVTIEARMGSTRLPEKMTKELFPGLTALEAVIERLKSCKSLDGIIVATTTNKKDDKICDIAKESKVLFSRGSENDVLGRVVEAGKIHKANVLVLVTGDCPCVSPKLIDQGVSFFLSNSYDFVSNCLKDVYPIGIDLQIANLSALEKAHKMAILPKNCYNTDNFEHTNYFISKHPQDFSIYEYPAPPRYNRPDIQLVLDTDADLNVLRNIFAKLYPANKFFDIDDILELLDREKDILKPLKGLKINRTGVKND